MNLSCTILLFSVTLVYSNLCYDNETLTDEFTLAYTKTLSELPLKRLLKVKNSFDFNEDIIETTSEVINQTQLTGLNSTSPEALALFSEKQSYGHQDHNAYYGFDHKHVIKEKKSKFLSTIFQISIVALAFLAFGGYLLCLIIQAIKAKAHINMNMTAANVQTIYRRRRRKKPIRLRPIRVRPKRGANITYLEELPDVDYEDLYTALTMFTEGYAKYHQTFVT